MVEVVPDYTRLYSYPMFFFIDFKNLVNMRNIYNQTIAYHLSGQGGACRPWDEWNTMCACKMDQCFKVFIRFGHGYTHWQFTVS